MAVETSEGQCLIGSPLPCVLLILDGCRGSLRIEKCDSMYFPMTYLAMTAFYTPSLFAP